MGLLERACRDMRKARLLSYRVNAHWCRITVQAIGQPERACVWAQKAEATSKDLPRATGHVQELLASSPQPQVTTENSVLGYRAAV